jgi:hypothetical protein
MLYFLFPYSLILCSAIAIVEVANSSAASENNLLKFIAATTNEVVQVSRIQ